MGHPELIKYFVGKNFEYYQKHIEEIVDLLLRYNVAVDLNTDYIKDSKTDKVDPKRLNPGIETILLCKEKNVPLVIGSDAHTPGKICNNFTDTFKALKDIGIKNLYYFEKRKLHEYKIN